MGKEKYSKAEKLEKIEAVLAWIAGGLSVRKSCAIENVSVPWFLENVDGEQYARARDACADTHFDGLLDLAAKVQDGDIDPQAARVSADIIKWNVARMKPRSYGDRVALEHSGDLITATPPAPLAVMAELASRESE